MMKDINASLEISEYVKKIVSQPTFQETYKIHPQDFQRTRILTFADIVFFVLGLTGTTLEFEAEHFRKISGIKHFSTAAICKARDKISFQAFRELLTLLAKQLESRRLLQGYRLLAIDGTQLELPKTHELMAKYPGSNSNHPLCHATVIYDILNDYYLDAHLVPAPADERAAACCLLKAYPVDAFEIMLLDRGYPSIQMLQLLINQGRKYVMRIGKRFLQETNAFVQSDKTDDTFMVYYTKQRFRGTKGTVLLPFTFQLRGVKIELEGGQTEYLITNLSPEEFSREELGRLYGLRWSIETSFKHLKNALYLEEFCSKKENSIKQEFYSELIHYNINSQLLQMAQERYSQEKSSKKH